MIEEIVDSLVSKFETGEIDRRDLVLGVSAAATGGLLSGILGGHRSVSAQSDQASTRAEVLLSRVANLRVTIEDDDLVLDQNHPLIFSAVDHQHWLFDPATGLLSGGTSEARERMDENLSDAVGAPHAGVGPGNTSHDEGLPVRRVASNSKTLRLFDNTPERSPFIHKVFDMKLEITETEGMFHLGKELHTWSLTNQPTWSAALRQTIGKMIKPYYNKYFPCADLDAVLTKLDNTKVRPDGPHTLENHDW